MKRLLKSWFHEIFFRRERIFRFSTLWIYKKFPLAWKYFVKSIVWIAMSLNGVIIWFSTLNCSFFSRKKSIIQIELSLIDRDENGDLKHVHILSVIWNLDWFHEKLSNIYVVSLNFPLFSCRDPQVATSYIEVRAENLAHVNKLLRNTELWRSWRLA